MNSNKNKDDHNYYNRIYISILLLFIVASAGIFSSIKYANKNYQDDIRNWNIRLKITAETRTDNLQKWLNSQIEELKSVANNTSLKLYMSEIFHRKFNDVIDHDYEQSQLTFLRNYILSVAQKNNYFTPSPADRIPANVIKKNVSGISILGKDSYDIVSTFRGTIITGDVMDFLKKNNNKPLSIKDIFFNEDNEPMIAFMVPIYSIQGDNTDKDIIGSIFAMKKIGQEVSEILIKPTSPEKTSESYLIAHDKRNKSAIYISALKDKRIKIGSTLSKDKGTIGYEILTNNKPDGISKNYSGERVLYTSKTISEDNKHINNKNINWKLIHKVDEIEALKDSKEKRKSLISISILLISSLIISVIAIWRHSSSVKYQRLALQFKSQERLLRLVTDNQPDATYIVDKNSICRFANLSAANNYKSSVDEIVGKSLIQVADKDRVEDYINIQKQVIDHNEPISEIIKTKHNNNDIVIKSNYIPLSKIPRVIDGKNSEGMLVIETDITDVIEEKEKRERVLSQLVNTIVRLVDTRDSNSSEHSQKVSVLAKSIAEEMELSDVEIDAVAVAGEIMNIGKIFLPISLLMKEGKLTNEEKKQISTAMVISHEIVEDIEFNGPVVETLKQSQETFDGKGRLKLSGDEILMTARIINVANAFVAMSSKRSYREKIEYGEILQFFMKEANKKYDRKVIVSLASYVEKNEDYVNEVFF